MDTKQERLMYKNRRNNIFRFIKTFLSYIQTANSNSERAQAVQQFKMQFQDLNYQIMQAEQDQSVSLSQEASDFKWVLEFIGALHTNSLKWEITLNRVNNFKSMVNSIQRGGNDNFMKLYNNPQTSDQWKEWMRYLYQDVIQHENAVKAVIEDEKARATKGQGIILAALKQWDKNGEAFSLVSNLLKTHGNDYVKIGMEYKEETISVVSDRTAFEMGLIKGDRIKPDFFGVTYIGYLNKLFQMQSGQAQSLQKITRYYKYISKVTVFKRTGNTGWNIDDELSKDISRLIPLIGDQRDPDVSKNFSLYLIKQISNESIPLDMDSYKFVLDAVRNMIRATWSEWQFSIQVKKQYLAAFGKRENRFEGRIVDDDSLVHDTDQNGNEILKQNPLADVKFLAYTLELALNRYRLYQYTAAPTTQEGDKFKSFGIFGKLFSSGKPQSNKEVVQEVKEIVHLRDENRDLDIRNLTVDDLLQYSDVSSNCQQILNCLLGKSSDTLCILKPQEVEEIKRNPKYIDSVKQDFKGNNQTFAKRFNNLGTKSPIRDLLGQKTSKPRIDLTASFISPAYSQSMPQPDVRDDITI